MASNPKQQLVTSMLLISTFMLALILPIIASTCTKEEAAGKACLPYITGKAASNASPSELCCKAIKGLIGSYNDKAAEITSCECLKAIGHMIPGINIDKATACVAACGDKLPFDLGFGVNCTTGKR
ncbi:Non-specific lipid-transfer protein 1-like protein [Drosera capensis]